MAEMTSTEKRGALSIAPEDPRTDELRALLGELDAELFARYPEAVAGGVKLAAPDLFVPPDGAFVVAREQARPLGCGALLRLSGNLVEVKRMFVRAEARGQGVARRVLAALEDLGRAWGASTIRLETGCRQPEAIALYRSCGYRDIPRYPPYEDDPLSVCFAKAL